MTPPKRVLLVITSENPQFYSDGKKTGLFWAEAWHPYSVYSKAGFGVDVASETGAFGFDEHSIQDDVMDAESKAAWHDPGNPLKKLLDNSLLKASDVDPSKYGIFFAAGGHAAVFDFPNARGLHEIASKIYAADGVVAAVCHGPAILPGIKDLATGESVVKGRKVTGFTAEGERLFQVEETMKKLGVHTVEELVTQAGGIYGQPPGKPLDDYCISDGRVVSGVNPASATSTAELTLSIYTDLVI